MDRTLAVAAFSLLIVSGCVVPVEKTTRSWYSIRSPVVRGRAAAPDVEARAGSGLVHVRISQPRTCRQDITRVAVTRAELVSELRTGDGDEAELVRLLDPRAAVAAAVIGIPVLVTSALVTGVVVTIDQPDTTRTARVQRIRFACPEPRAASRVQLVLASGRTLEGTTDREGSVTFRIPEGEPPRGAVTVRAAGLAPRVLPYVNLPRELDPEEVRAGLEPLRRSLVACAADHGLSGEVVYVIAVGPSGELRGIRASGGGSVVSEAVTDCAVEVTAGIRFPPSRQGARGRVTLRIPPRAEVTAMIEP